MTLNEMRGKDYLFVNIAVERVKVFLRENFTHRSLMLSVFEPMS